jgi:FkbM family methyltransferase
MPSLSELLTLPSRMAALQRELNAMRSALPQAIAAGVAAALAAQPRAIPLDGAVALAMLEGRLPIHVDPRAGDIAPHLMLTGQWEPVETRLWRRLLRPGMLTLDVGAHLGVYALLAAEALGEAAAVHAFEPNPALAALLARSVALNGFGGRITLHGVAAGAGDGVASLMVRPGLEGGGFRDAALPGPPRPDGFVPVPVRVVAIDSLLSAGELGAAKLDIEGMEGQALRGMAGLLGRSPGARLLLEWAPAMLAGQGMPGPAVVAFLEGFGFRFWSVGPDGALVPLPGPALAGLSEGLRNIVAARELPA